RAREELEQTAQGRVYAIPCDIGVEADVTRLAEAAQQLMNGVNVFIANAGIYGPKGPLETIEWRSWVETIQINLIGTVYCCKAFLPLLKENRHSKILIVSGGGATRPLPFLSAYAASKAGIVRFGETLAEELKPLGIEVNMIAPGALNTRMLDEVLTAGPEK